MTLPRERGNALKKAYRLLRDLLDPKKTPKVPRYVREEAYRCLKHHPGYYHIEELQRASPEILGELEAKEED